MFLDRIPVRFRLSLGHAVWMAVLFLAVGFGLYRVVYNNLYESLDSALISTARAVRDARFAKRFDNGPINHFLQRFFGDPINVDQFFDERFIRPYAQLINVTGQIRSRTDNLSVSLPVTPKAVAKAEKGLHSFETFHLKNNPPLRQITLPVTYYGRFTGELVQVGTSLEGIHHTLRGVGIVLWLALPFGLFLSVLFGYLLTARALKPVQNISQAAAKMGIKDLSVRLPLPEAQDELRELSKTFNDMMDRLEDAVTRLRRFSGDVSHELRTPLAVLRGEAELALRRKRSPDEYEEALKSIVNEAMHMTGIIENLLLLARAESQSVAMNWMELKLQAFIDELQTNVSPFYLKKKVSLNITIGENLETFFANTGFLSLALSNLLLNAVKHSPEGNKVEFSVIQSENGLKFSVRDFGEGIPKKDLPHIFESFYRADTARNRAAGGAGIGLSLAQALVKLHGGKISVTSVETEGSTFCAFIRQPEDWLQKNRSRKKTFSRKFIRSGARDNKDGYSELNLTEA